MRRRALILAAGVVAVALAVPTLASAVLATITDPTDPTAVASCPGTATMPCTVISRTTAEQVQVGSTSAPFRVHTAGVVVGWQITLSSPTATQIRYFDAHEGGASQAALAVIRQVHALDYRLVAVSPGRDLAPDYGESATFALRTPIPVAAGDVIALTVPTWVPALELSAGRKTAWRASRGLKACNDVTAQTAQIRPRSVAEYACIYRTALVDFGAIEISTP
jgi:hypothetical protein